MKEMKLERLWWLSSSYIYYITCYLIEYKYNAYVFMLYIYMYIDICSFKMIKLSIEKVIRFLKMYEKKTKIWCLIICFDFLE